MKTGRTVEDSRRRASRLVREDRGKIERARWPGAEAASPTPSRRRAPGPRALPAFVEPALATLAARPPPGDALAARDQVRRLPPAGPHRRRPGEAADPQRPRLDRPVRHDIAAGAGGAAGRHRAPRRRAGGRERGAAPRTSPRCRPTSSAGRSDRFRLLRFRPAATSTATTCARRRCSTRKDALARAARRRRGDPLRYSEHFDEDGDVVLRHACRLSLEGHRLQAARRALSLGPRQGAG